MPIKCYGIFYAASDNEVKFSDQHGVWLWMQINLLGLIILRRPKLCKGNVF